MIAGQTGKKLVLELSSETLQEMDRIWVDAAARLGIKVVRGGESFVYFDGQRLHIAADEHLDDDDTVAQLVFHELCHCYVQGPENRFVPDWGLDNTCDKDAVNEAAAVRLQVHLLRGYGLRQVLYPTHVIRDFFEALPDDAFLPADDDSARLARLSALRIAQPGVREVIHGALLATRRLVDSACHPKTGLPLGRDGHVCGDCAARTNGGLCRHAEGRVMTRADEPACTRWEPPLDCLRCGACCRSAYDVVMLGPREAAARRHPELIWKDGSHLSIRRAGDRCAALQGLPGGPFRCAIYEERPRTCRDFERGGRNCFDARRRVGLGF